MGRNILLITADQMRYDALGCNGGQVARTPALDALSGAGINYRRAHNQHVLCMPARSTILTGQYPATHGVTRNGVALPPDAPNVAGWLHERGYRTALFGKAHFEPWLGAPERFFENRMASEGSTGPHRGFERMELANHFFEGHSHYDRFIHGEHPEHVDGFYRMITDRGQNTASMGETGAVQVWRNPVPRGLYHTDWVADRTIDWLGSLPDDADFFCWMSFPDPHHPWDPPESELSRVPWRDVPLPDLYPGDAEGCRAMLQDKPAQYLAYFDAELWSNLESPRDFVPAQLTPDQIREVNAMNHIENELIDEACARVLSSLQQRGWAEDTDVFFTADHGELQGDFGLLFKGPYHLDALMRLPFIWRPAPVAGVAAAEVGEPVGHVDLASTFCDIAGVPAPPWVQGQVLPRSDAEASAQGRQRVLTQWDSDFGTTTMHLRTIYRREGYLCTAYQPGSMHDGSEGELYDMRNDPGQRHNLWNDPARRGLREDLVAELREHQPPDRAEPLELGAPV